MEIPTCRLCARSGCRWVGPGSTPGHQGCAPSPAEMASCVRSLQMPLSDPATAAHTLLSCWTLISPGTRCHRRNLLLRLRRGSMWPGRCNPLDRKLNININPLHDSINHLQHNWEDYGENILLIPRTKCTIGRKWNFTPGKRNKLHMSHASHVHFILVEEGLFWWYDLILAKNWVRWFCENRDYYTRILFNLAYCQSMQPKTALQCYAAVDIFTVLQKNM